MSQNYITPRSANPYAVRTMPHWQHPQVSDVTPTLDNAGAPSSDDPEKILPLPIRPSTLDLTVHSSPSLGIDGAAFVPNSPVLPLQLSSAPSHFHQAHYPPHTPAYIAPLTTSNALPTQLLNLDQYAAEGEKLRCIAEFLPFDLMVMHRELLAAIPVKKDASGLTVFDASTEASVKLLSALNSKPKWKKYGSRLFCALPVEVRLELAKTPQLEATLTDLFRSARPVDQRRLYMSICETVHNEFQLTIPNRATLKTLLGLLALHAKDTVRALLKESQVKFASATGDVVTFFALPDLNIQRSVMEAMEIVLKYDPADSIIADLQEVLCPGKGAIAAFRTRMSDAFASKTEADFQRCFAQLKKSIPASAIKVRNRDDFVVEMALEELGNQPARHHAEKFQWLLQLLMKSYPKNFAELCTQKKYVKKYKPSVEKLSVKSGDLLDLVRSRQNTDEGQKILSLLLQLSLQEAQTMRASVAAASEKNRVLCESIATTLQSLQHPSAPSEDLKYMARMLVVASTHQHLGAAEFCNYFLANPNASTLNLIGAVLQEACIGQHPGNSAFGEKLIVELLENKALQKEGLSCIATAAPMLAGWLANKNNADLWVTIPQSRYWLLPVDYSAPRRGLYFIAASLNAAKKINGSAAISPADIITLQTFIATKLNALPDKYHAEIITLVDA